MICDDNQLYILIYIYCFFSSGSKKQCIPCLPCFVVPGAWEFWGSGCHISPISWEHDTSFLALDVRIPYVQTKPFKDHGNQRC